VVAKLKDSVVSPAQRLKQDEFLFAIRLLAAGSFYHQWTGNLKSEVRFKLQLSEKGKRLGADQRRVFREGGFEDDTESVSSDPLKMERVFKKVPKPLPREFVRMFTVDTLLGRWMPAGISNLVSARLDRALAPYMDQVRRLTEDASLHELCKRLDQRVADFLEKGVIEGAEDVVNNWRARVERFRENEALLRRIVFNLEKLEEPLGEMDRTLILQTYDSLRGSVEVKGYRGALKKALATAIRKRPEDCVGLFHELTESAEEHLS
jgi:hypothetical protein